MIYDIQAKGIQLMKNNGNDKNEINYNFSYCLLSGYCVSGTSLKTGCELPYSEHSTLYIRYQFIPIT